MDIQLLQPRNHPTAFTNQGRSGNPFRSFWMGGFECSDKLNAFGNRVDLLSLTGHLELVDEDYMRLSIFGIQTVREGIRWSQVEKTPYVYDWSTVVKLIRAGAEYGIQQIWDICHFGFPDDLTPLHPMFARRFGSLCKAFVQCHQAINPGTELIVTPINEVSFLSWLGGDVRGTSPYCVGQGWEVKYALMKAYIEGIEAMKALNPDIRILVTEPLINVVAPENCTPEASMRAAEIHNDQFQVFDILSGNICPELKGKPEYLDIIGCNYYFNNQWSIDRYEILPWRNENDDYRFLSLSKLVAALYQRYQRPVILSETSHPKEDRPLWVSMITDETIKILEQAIPFWGICWYPIIDRPDWDNLADWHQAGLWDAGADPEYPERHLHAATARALHVAQYRLRNYLYHSSTAGAAYKKLAPSVSSIQ